MFGNVLQWLGSDIVNDIPYERTSVDKYLIRQVHRRAPGVRQRADVPIRAETAVVGGYRPDPDDPPATPDGDQTGGR